jgi:hypothetical protein
MQLLDDNLWGLFQAGKISPEECIDKSRNPGQIVDKMQRAGLNVEKADDALMAEAAEAGDAAPAAGAAKPAGAASSEAERQAQIAANRARMQAQAKK